MRPSMVRLVPAVLLIAGAVVWVAPRISGQAGAPGAFPSTKNGEWPMYTADLTGSEYSPLDR